MKKFTAVFILGLAFLVFGATDSFAQRDFTCAGSFNNIRVANVVVPNGATCQLTATRVLGNIQLGRNSSFIGQNVRVNGSIQSDGGNNLSLSNSILLGSFQVKLSNSVNVSGTTLNGSVQLEENRGVLNISTSTMNGDLQAKKNRGAINLLGNIRVLGNIQVEENLSEIQISNNLTEGDLQVFKNLQSILITDNVIRQNFQCGENALGVTESGNAVGGDRECKQF